jgi:hypothetical protein
LIPRSFAPGARQRRHVLRAALAATLTAIAVLTTGGAAQAAGVTHWVKDKGAVAPPGTSCGKPGYTTIQSAVTAATAGDTIIVCGGRYAENVVVDKSVTIRGQGDPKVVPTGEDANTDNSAGALQIAFRVDADDVTIRDLTVDGQGNPDLTKNKDNFRYAVRLPFVTPPPTTTGHNRLTVRNLNIRNIYRRAIQLEGGTGHVIAGNDIDRVDVGFGVIAFETKATAITNNKIKHSPEGIGSNYLTTAVNAPVLDIAGNDINQVDFGLDISGLGAGSTVHDNKVDVKGGANDGIGAIVQYATGHVELTSNRIEGSHGDAGAWLYHNEEDSDVVVAGNDIRAADSEDTGVGSATGIFMTDDGDLFGDEDGSSYADVNHNEIRHWVRGVHVYRNGDEPPPGRPVQPTIRGSFTANCIQENRAWGMLVSGTNAAVGGDVAAENNWWGAKDGPSGAGPGHGDAVSPLVDFTPWATDAKVCKT